MPIKFELLTFYLVNFRTQRWFPTLYLGNYREVIFVQESIDYFHEHICARSYVCAHKFDLEVANFRAYLLPGTQNWLIINLYAKIYPSEYWSSFNRIFSPYKGQPVST